MEKEHARTCMHVHYMMHVHYLLPIENITWYINELFKDGG